MVGQTPVTTDAQSTPPRLGATVIDLLRLVRTLRAEYRACSELLSLSLELLGDTERELDDVRERYHARLDDLKRLKAELTRVRAALRQCEMGSAA